VKSETRQKEERTGTRMVMERMRRMKNEGQDEENSGNKLERGGENDKKMTIVRRGRNDNDE